MTNKFHSIYITAFMPQPGGSSSGYPPYPVQTGGGAFPPYPTSNFGGFPAYPGATNPTSSGYPPYPMPNPTGYNNFYGGSVSAVHILWI